MLNKVRIVSIAFATLLFTSMNTAAAWQQQPGADLALLAVKRRDEQKLEEAMSIVSKALEINPNLPEGYYVRGTIYNNQSKYKLAMADFDRTLELFPNFPAALGDRSRLKFALNNDTQGAIQDVSKSLDLLKDAHNYAFRGYLYSKIGKNELANQDFATAISMDARDASIYEYRGNAALEQGRFKSAILDYTSAINLQPCATDYAERGSAYFYIENYDSALSDYKTAARLNEKYAGLASAVETYKLIQARKYAEASVKMGSTFNAKGKTAPEYFVKACVELGEGKVATGAYYLKEAIALYNKFPAAYVMMAAIKAKIDGDTKGAITDLDKAISITPTASAYIMRAALFSKQANFDAALADLISATKFDPKNADVLRLRGIVAFKAGKFDQAIMLFSSLLDGEKKSAVDLVFRSYSYLYTNQLDKAQKDLEIAKTLEPDRESIHLGLARILLEQKRLDEALSELGLVLKKNPSNTDALIDRGWALYIKKKYSEAYSDFGRALRVTPKSVDALLGAGISCAKLAKFETAKQYLDAALKLSPKAPPSVLLWRAVIYMELAKYTDAIADINAILDAVNKDPSKKWSNLDIQAQIIKSQLQFSQGKYKESIETCKSILNSDNKNVDKNDKLMASRIIQQCNAVLQTVSNTADQAAMVKAAGDFIANGDPQAKLLDNLFKNKVATKHFVFLSNLPEQKLLYYAQFAEGFLDVIDSQFVKLKDAPLTRVYLVSNHHEFLDFVFHHFPGEHEARAAYFHGPNAIVFGDEDGIGVLSHEIMHKVVTENLPHADKWAVEGIPVYFEQLYGYYDQDKKLVLKLGLQSPIRMNNLADVISCNLSDTLSTADITAHEGRVGMVSMFLDQSNKFKPYLELSKLNGKGAYSYMVEAVYGKSIPELEPLWSEFLKNLAKEKTKVDLLLSPRIFATKADYLEAEKTGFVDDVTEKLGSDLLSREKNTTPEDDTYSMLPAAVNSTKLDGALPGKDGSSKGTSPSPNKPSAAGGAVKPSSKPQK